MAWQDMFAGSATRINAEYEQELNLAAQARVGADWALGALIARYQPTVTRYLTRLTGNPPRARLLSEQIFLRMERRLHGPHGGQHLRLWLLRASTESGLDELRKPHHTMPRVQLEASSHPRALLPELPDRLQESASTHHQTDTAKTEGTADRLRAGLGALADRTGSTRRQLRQLIWSPWSDSPTSDETSSDAATTDTRYQKQATGFETTSSSGGDLWDATETDVPADEEDLLDPREVLRYRMIRAVLAELPYGDAQCLALHLIANLNQAEVSRALGITASATRRRIVSGLQLFAQRYDAASASLGISLDTLESRRQTEVMEELEEERDESLALPAHQNEATPPSRRDPIVVSAQLTTPLPADTSAGDEPVIVWDLPPFDDLVNIETQPLPDSVEESDPAELPTMPAETAGVTYDDDVTRRLIWSRPAAYRQTPVTSGDEVTTRLTRHRKTATTGDGSSTTTSAGGAVDRVEEAWTYTEKIETISEPPPEAMVVDAGPPVVVPTRTVPILTTFVDEPHHVSDHDSPARGSSRPAADGARVISVLTPNSLTSPGDGQLPKSGGGSGSGDHYHSSTF